jgi:hypothetical protein
MTTTVKEIIEAKARAGQDAFLILYRDACCLLWDCEPASICESNAIGRWQLDDIEYDQLVETGLADEVENGSCTVI